MIVFFSAMVMTAGPMLVLAREFYAEPGHAETDLRIAHETLDRWLAQGVWAPEEWPAIDVHPSVERYTDVAVDVLAPYVRFRWVQTVSNATTSKLSLRARV